VRTTPSRDVASSLSSPPTKQPPLIAYGRGTRIPNRHRFTKRPLDIMSRCIVSLCASRLKRSIFFFLSRMRYRSVESRRKVDCMRCLILLFIGGSFRSSSCYKSNVWNLSFDLSPKMQIYAKCNLEQSARYFIYAEVIRILNREVNESMTT